MYDTLDSLIVAAVRHGRRPLYDQYIRTSCSDLGVGSGRRVSQLISARMQALRKRGVIKHLTKSTSNGKSGWYLVSGKESNHE